MYVYINVTYMYENTAKAISSGKEKSSREKMREMLDKCRNKKLFKSVPVDQRLIPLHKEGMELKREMLRKMDHQEQQFNQTMKILQENATRFTDIVSGIVTDIVFNSNKATLCSHREIIIHLMTQASPN